MEDWAVIAMRIADAAGIPLLERLALLLGMALLVLLFGKVKALRLPPYTPEPPPPPAEWGDNVRPNDGPPGGGMEGG